ncbi:MAG TPA: hypothetical protein VFT91_00370 [Dehalococcoidia bacterium]|nr:hypothetical protein [Dehalococcoidia bacterium]
MPLTVTSFDATQISPYCKGYQDAAFNGQKAFFGPYRRKDVSGSVPHGWFLAYDTGKPFTSAGSWETADLAALVDPAAQGMLGVVIDSTTGKLLLVPYEKDIGYGKVPNDLAVLFDTSRPLTDPAAYQKYHIGGALVGWASGTFLHPHFYLCPVNNVSTGALHGRLVRYDVRKPFARRTSWQSFAVTAVHSDAMGFQSTGNDGRWVSFGPFARTVAVRYDSTKPFRSASSYDTVDLTDPQLGGANAKGYTGIVVAPIPRASGAYIYYVPWCWHGPGSTVTYLSTAARYDNRKPFTDPTAWEFFDMATVNAVAKGYEGGWYDNKTVNFVSTFNGVDPPPVASHDPGRPLNDPGAWTFTNVPVTYPPSTGAAFDVNAAAYAAPYGIDGDSGVVHRFAR